jgi:hypothetical protein
VNSNRILDHLTEHESEWDKKIKDDSERINDMRRKLHNQKSRLEYNKNFLKHINSYKEAREQTDDKSDPNLETSYVNAQHDYRNFCAPAPTWMEIVANGPSTIQLNDYPSPIQIPSDHENSDEQQILPNFVFTEPGTPL